MDKKIIVFLFGIALVTLTGLTMPSCGSKTNTTAETTTTPEATPSVILNEAPLATVDATTYDATLTADYEKAEVDAKKWQSNAELVMVSVKLPSDLSLNNATQTYTYGSSNDTQYWWTYSLSEQTQKFVRALVNKEDYLGTSLTPIPKKFWRTNFIEAFQIADNYQGAEFRLNNQNVEITETLSVGKPNNYLWWLVEYKTPLGNNLTVRINPNDRTIVDESGNIITTGKTYTPESTYSSTTTGTAGATSAATSAATSTAAKTSGL